MNYRIFTLFIASIQLCLSAFAAPPKVTNVVATQQVGTKLVNITYNLELDEGETAYVELWFSPDNGLSFPISAKSVTGSVNAGVNDGASKTAVWNAGADWDQRFTQHGKIRVIAFYGNQPSGNASGHWQGDSNLATLEIQEYWALQEDGTYYDYSQWLLPHVAHEADVVKADTAEVTNAEWNEVTEWALANGYDLLPIVPESAEGDKPVTGINYWQAIKWCNARSEKEGLEPAYYLDISEVIGDLNGDGQITNGPDIFNNYDAAMDLNGNGKWDEGEPFIDPNANDVYEPIEWVDLNLSERAWNPGDPETDLNENAVQDPGETGIPGLDYGLSQVFRTGATIPGYGEPVVFTAGPAVGKPMHQVQGFEEIHLESTHQRTKFTAQGYRLPTQEIQAMLAIAGNQKKKWPWGNDSPADASSQFSEFGIVSATADQWYDGPLSAANRGSNAFGLKDILGNVAEWSEGVSQDHLGTLDAAVFGGSYQGLDRAGTPKENGEADPESSFGHSPTENLFQTYIHGPPGDSTPAIGLRCVRYK
ncbi:MAG: SUMF1/EgtB/PvdO family nonheme iron enzyme [Opitutales bacterium]|nr:SUMF1/EgtB/PvdO family nonheme iron enzyme [Opitutales bacterium]